MRISVEASRQLPESTAAARLRHLVFAITSALLLVLMWGAVRDLIHYAWDFENKNASQVFLVPFVTAALLFMNREKIFRRLEYGALPGAIVIIGGLALWFASRTWGSRLADEGDRLALGVGSLIVLWIGCFLIFYGSHAFRAALFPLLFLVFAIPIPSPIMDPLVAFLRRGSTEISFVLLKLTGTPVFRDGFVFAMPRYTQGPPAPGLLTIEVADECSGIRSCISMLILTVLAGNMLLNSWRRRLLLVLVALAVMLFKNALRIATLSLLTIYVNPGIIESRLHREGGIPFFVVALVLLYPVLSMMIRSERGKWTTAKS